MTDWVEIRVPTAAETAGEIAALLSEQVPDASAGCQLRDDGVVFWVELGRAEPALVQTRTAVANLAALGLSVDPAEVSAEPAAPESEWRNAWKRYFKVTRVTRRIVIVPSWESYTAAPEELRIDMDPGLAFGTGAHASTQLCLELMEQLSDRNAGVERFWDLGCGSGILAIAAQRLWPAATGEATDHDPDAIRAAGENLARNRVDQVRCSTDDTDQVAGQFDLILANIQRPVLLTLRDTVVARTGGFLVLSGLLTEHVQEVANAYVAAGLRLVELRRSSADPEWTAALLERPTAGGPQSR